MEYHKLTMKRYYQQQGCLEGRTVQAGDYKVQFEPVMFFAGQWWGIFATEDEKIQSALNAVIGKQGVSETTQYEFEAMAKKKGIRQTHTWVVTEAVSAERPTPQQPQERSAVSATVDAPAPAEPISTPEKSHELNDLLQTAPRDDASASKEFVTTQAALSEILGVSLPKLRDLSKLDGNPGKADQGYSVSMWKSFLNNAGQ